MNKLLLTAAIITLMAACDQKTENVSSDSTNSDSTAVGTSISDEDKEERNKKTALASVKAIETGNIDSVLKDVTDDAIDYGDGTGPSINNKDSLNVVIKSFNTAFPDWKGEHFMAAADGDYVYVYGDWSGTFKNDYMGMKATGKKLKVKDVDIFKFNDKGQIVEHRSIQNWSSMMSQAGGKTPK